MTSDGAGLCGSLHGHSYRVKLTISGPVISATGMVINFHDLAPFKEYLEREFDHCLVLNPEDPLVNIILDNAKVQRMHLMIRNDPTAENMASEMLSAALRMFNSFGVYVSSVEVWETEKCSARANQ